MTNSSAAEEKKEEVHDTELKSVPLKKQDVVAMKDDKKASNDPKKFAPEELTRLADPALGHASLKPKETSQKGRQSGFLSLIATLLRSVVLDAPLMLLFSLYIAVTVLHKIHDEYLGPQVQLMRFIEDGRDFTDTTYYHRHCDGYDVSATSVDDLLIHSNASSHDAMIHMLKHGVSLYPNLLTPETSWELREFIDRENKLQKGWFVIENEHRYSWGIDVNQHPSIQKYWKELSENEHFVKSLEAIVGPDPAIIEFTAITSAYGAKDQHDHQDVIPPASGTKFARTFVPSYSLFIPLQDTSYDMGATHVCPGTHLCSSGCEEHCKDHNLAMSGDDVWPQGWGALINQQTTHKGMGHFKKGGLDRVVIIATFAPRPHTHRGLETRMIGQGGSYSLKWSLWGHTFSDFVHAEERMTEPQKTMRSLGLIKGGGWNMISVTSMRISNEDTGYAAFTLGDFLKEGGFWFLPISWQDTSLEEKNPWFQLLVGILRCVEEKLPPVLKKFWDYEVEKEDEPEESKITSWHQFLLDTVKRSENQLYRLNCLIVSSYLLAVLLLDILLCVSKHSNGSVLLRSLRRLSTTYFLVFLSSMLYLHVIGQSNWAKDIRSGKAHRLPELHAIEDVNLPLTTLPLQEDILIAPQYASDFLASYSLVLEVSHPGNSHWKDLTQRNADGYVALPSQSMKKQFCQSIVNWVSVNSRFLIQDHSREWTVIDEMDVLLDFCNKELVMSSNRLTEALARQLESLKTETKYGRWHDKAIHKTTIPLYLDAWEKRLIPSLNKEKNPGQKPEDVFAARQLAVLKTRGSEISTFRTRQSLPPSPSPQEPFVGAWLREGDLVEAMYHCQHNEWYQARIVGAVSNEGTWDVEYSDGDIDESLTRACVRPFRPYEIDEVVEVRVSEDEFVNGKVVQTYGKEGLYDIEIEVSGLIIRNVSADDIRRFDLEETLEVGRKVVAAFQGGEEWFPGRVVRVNKDGSYGIKYNDGDFEPKLEREFVRAVKDHATSI